MSSYDSITTFVERYKTLPRLDFAVLNAGVLQTTLELKSPLVTKRLCKSTTSPLPY